MIYVAIGVGVFAATACVCVFLHGVFWNRRCERLQRLARVTSSSPDAGMEHPSFALKAENQRMRKALEDIVRPYPGSMDPNCPDPPDPVDIARAALEDVKVTVADIYNPKPICGLYMITIDHVRRALAAEDIKPPTENVAAGLLETLRAADEEFPDDEEIMSYVRVFVEDWRDGKLDQR